MEVRRLDRIIIGAGLAGLGAAKRGGGTILERSEGAFGHASSYEIDGCYYDHGAHICHSSNAQWLCELELYNKYPVKKALVKNYYQGRFLGYPIQFHLRDLSPDVIVKCLTSYDSRPKGDAVENYDQWCRFQYGDFITDQFYALYTSKYWRSKMCELDVDWLGGRVIPIEPSKVFNGALRHQSGEVVFNEFRYPSSGGFQRFFSHFPKGLDIAFGETVVSVDLNSRLVETVSGSRFEYQRLVNTMALPRFLDILSPRLLDTHDLGATPYLNLIQSIVYVPRELFSADQKCSWFYVYDPAIDFSRVLNMDLVSNDEGNSYYRLQVETFRRSDETFVLREIEKNVLFGIKEIFSGKASDQISVRDIRNLGMSYVIPVRGLQQRVSRVIKQLEKFGIHSVGLFGRWKYIWSDEAFYSGFRNYG